MTYTGKPVRVTTVLGRFKPADGLLKWAWDLGRQGLDYRIEREKAADIGTAAHEVIGLIHKGKRDKTIGAYLQQALPEEGMRVRALRSAQNFLEWAREQDLHIKQEEVEVTSALHAFVGHIDGIGTQGPMGVLIDYKTSRAVYPEYLMQVAAYSRALLEQEGTQVEKAVIVRIDKDTAAFEPVWLSWEDLEEPWQQFLRLRQAYEAEKGIKALLRRKQKESSR